jgi:hypothetical protein
MGENGNLPDVTPRPPEWALKAGLPPPAADETLHAYCRRLGVDYGRLTDGLDARTIGNVHLRFVNVLADRCPDGWRTHVEEFVGRHKLRPRPKPAPDPFRY